MLILGVDTSGKNGSIALVRFESGDARTIEMVPLEGGTFSAQLVPQISGLLKKHELSKSDIDSFAVASGPGSFTGLRVGLAAIKALAEILQKPIAAVSLLEAVARGAEAQGTIVAALDAGRGEVYCSEYELSGRKASSSKSTREQSAAMITEELLSAQEFLTRAENALIATCDDKIAYLARENNLQVMQVVKPRADAIARLGFEKIQAGETVSPEALDANYIRRSDAEVHKSSSMPT
ncbi:MAG TPA: tRNA (adenosine(37)-N6)-threonylcarbamoyltransferase complex dimerization subunit type 1 TsaB [Candidatus Polarisedimenticolia bacterium]|nr:tRNA (adenosine(37)-N6)-threonylcarbamoyltransferase complex dimerization subunit type 1 TsaB [Candidatus Polarisedimenticolia bacterium]